MIEDDDNILLGRIIYQVLILSSYHSSLVFRQILKEIYFPR